MHELRKILSERENLTEKEAEEEILWMQFEVLQGADPEELLADIGLEPDYILDIIPVAGSITIKN